MGNAFTILNFATELPQSLPTTCCKFIGLLFIILEVVNSPPPPTPLTRGQARVKIVES